MKLSSRSKRAVVIGGSIAGMCAARVLAKHFDRVMVIENDEAPADPAPRKGVPQGNHGHALLKSGSRALEELFPGLTRDIIRAGSTPADSSADICWFHHGHWKTRSRVGMEVIIQTRPFLEWHVRRRLRQHANVAFVHATKVQGLLANSRCTRVRGVHGRRHGRSIDLFADLVVDASGRGSQTPRWLADLGHQPPPETAIDMDLAYSSRLFRPRPDVHADWKCLSIYPTMPATTRLGSIFSVENNTWLVTLGGYLGDHPPTDDAGFLAFARSLVQPHIAEALAHADPISPIKVYRCPRAVRRHYERLSALPRGLVVLGDAVCALDPVFGQGMSVAVKEALLLEQCLRRYNPDAASFGPRYHRRQAKIVDTAWLLAASEIKRYPQIQPRRPAWLRFLHWYTDRVFELSAERSDVHGAFLEVMHLTAEPRALFRPGVAFRVLEHTLQSRGAQPAKRPRPALTA